MERLKTFLILLGKFLFMDFYYRIEKFVAVVARQYDEKNKKLLDVGAANSPYRKYFRNIDYYTHDLKQNKEGSIDYSGDFDDGLALIKDGFFDYLLCTQILEHLREPSKAFREFHRLLRPGGKVFLTTNFIYQIHMEPNDFYRFTEYGLRYLGEANGFEVEHLKPHGGVFHVLAYIIATLPIRILFRRPGILYHLYLITFSFPIIILNLAADIADVFDREKKITINYEVVYRRI